MLKMDSAPILSTELVQDRQDYERLFCSSALINPAVALEKCAYILPEHFIHARFAEFWMKLKEHGDAMRAASEAHVLVDLTECASEIPTSLFPEHYASEMMRYRYLTEAADELSSIARSIEARDDIRVQEKVAKLHTAAAAANPVHLEDKKNTPAEISEEFIVRINTHQPSILTGLDDLDAVLGGLFMGELTIIAGRPGMGKTSVATAIAQHVATVNKDAKILFFSLEMDKIQLWARMACAKTLFSWKEIRSGRAEDYAIKAVEKASRELEAELEGRLIIEDSTWDVPGMIAMCAELKPSLVIVDHLGEIRWKDDNADEIRWFGRATKLLRTEISRRMHIPVLLIHQLSRKVEDRNDNRPVLSDLKWSGDLEAIADTVIMLYREDYYDDKLLKKPVVVPLEMCVRKNRQGVMNSTVVMNFDTSKQRFSPARLAQAQTTRLSAIDKTPHVWFNNEHENPLDDRT